MEIVRQLLNRWRSFFKESTPLAGSAQDLTGRKLSGAAGPASEAQFRLVTDAMPQMVWIAQPDGLRSYFNQKWADYTGLVIDESLGHGWARLIHADDSARAAGLWEQASGSDRVHEIEYRLRRADGAYRWMLERALALCDAAGRTTQWLGTVTDIDDLRQAAAILEKNHAIARIAGRVARLGGWTIELPERTLTWSDENCVIHDVPPGYKPTLDEGIGYFLPEHRATVIRHVEACVQHGTPYEFVLPKITAKGRRIWVRSIGEAVCDEAGKIIRIQGAFQDISEQKNTEARAFALETQLLTTLESITDGFYLLDKDWQFTFLNGRAERMLKRGRKDLLGKSLWLEFPEAVGTSIEREYRRTVEEQRTTHFEAFVLPLETWFDIHVYPTEAGIAVYLQDITQRRSEQAQLLLLETAVSRVNDIVIITQAEPLDETGGRIVFVNDAFERNTGYSRHEAIGSTPKILMGPKSRSAELDRILEAVKNCHAVRAEVVSYTKAGDELWLEIDLAPIADEAGRYTHWVAVERDITERRRQQQEILSINSELEERVQLRTSQMKVANRELEAFSYSVSHDLRSPLNTIYGFSQLLFKVDGDKLSEKGRHYLDRIRAGAKQMAELIEGLLTLAHLSREQLKAEDVDLSSIAGRVASDCQEREPRRLAQVQIQEGLSAHGDRRLLSAVFENLLGNAWKFTSRQALAKIDVGSGPGDDGKTVFFVRDNGVGFDAAFAHKLFGTFERLHSPEEFSGAGIGLATVKRVIERHGGRVWADSTLNEGATFYFTLGQTIESVA
jgi:PAS domain S-box-containing protein